MWFSHGEVYSMQFYMRKFSPDTPVSSTNKTDRYDITEILLKVKHHKPTNQPTIEKNPKIRHENDPFTSSTKYLLQL